MENDWAKLEEICVELNCPAEITFRIIGGKWRSRILWELIKQEPRRFSDLKGSLAGISVKVLASHLSELERMNLVRRRDYAEFPPRVEYSLSDVGRSLTPIFSVTTEWVAENLDAVRKILKEK